MIQLQETQTILTNNVRTAQTLHERLIGLMGSEPNNDYGFIIPHCTCVHTYLMNYSIDIIFFLSSGEIVGMYKNTPPGKVCPCTYESSDDEVSVLETPAHVCDSLKIGQILIITP